MSKKTGVLIVNLGTPDSPSTSDVKRYLSEFLNDPRVIDINPIGRKVLVNGIIVPTRGPKSAKEYKKLFKIGNGASPLLTYGKNLLKLVREIGHKQFDVELAMRYGNPSMNSILEKMRLANYDQIIIFPLYQLVLISIATIFGEFNYFLSFERSMFKKLFKKLK